MAFSPSSASGQATSDGLREYSRLTKEYVMDRPPVDLFNFQNFVEHDPDNTEGMGGGAPEFGEVSTSEIGGVLLAANSDAYGHLWVLPYWLDVEKQIDFRCLTSNSEAAATGSYVIAAKYTPIDVSKGSVALAVGATALDDTIASFVDLAANVPGWTQWGSISAGKAGVSTLTPGDDALALTFIVTLTVCANASLIQAQARGYRKYL